MGHPPAWLGRAEQRLGDAAGARQPGLYDAVGGAAGRPGLDCRVPNFPRDDHLYYYGDLLNGGHRPHRRGFVLRDGRSAHDVPLIDRFFCRSCCTLLVDKLKCGDACLRIAARSDGSALLRGSRLQGWQEY